MLLFIKCDNDFLDQFHYDDPDTNMGLVVSPLMTHQYREGTSIKVCIFPQYEGADSTKPVSFTCDGKYI